MRRIALALLALALALPTTGSVAPAPSDGGVPILDSQIPNVAIFAFKGPVPADAGAWIAAHGGKPLMRDDVIHWASAEFPDGASAGQAILAARARPDVRAAERDGIATTMQIPVLPIPNVPGVFFQPNDPMYGQQWGYPAIFAPEAWGITLGSHKVKVSVLDTGTQIDHPDLAANACGPFASFVPTEPTIFDYHGHGTHTSGTVAAVTNNAVGVAGTSQSCLMNGKVLTGGGWGQWEWVAAGIVWAADHGADVISMSLGGGAPPEIMHDAIKYAYNEKNVLIVAAAGNSYCIPGPIPGTVGYPAKYPEVIAVAATMLPGFAPAPFSSCGFKVELAAPGMNVLSTYHGSGYTTMSGTSMATPHVAGSAALVKAQDPGLSNVELRCILDLSATHEGPRNPNLGWGSVNPFQALLLDQQLTAAGAHGAFTQACLAGADVIFYDPLPF